MPTIEQNFKIPSNEKISKVSSDGYKLELIWVIKFEKLISVPAIELPISQIESETIEIRWMNPSQIHKEEFKQMTKRMHLNVNW